MRVRCASVRIRCVRVRCVTVRCMRVRCTRTREVILVLLLGSRFNSYGFIQLCYCCHLSASYYLSHTHTRPSPVLSPVCVVFFPFAVQSE